MVEQGRIGRYQYELRLARGPVSYGINPQTLYKGYGRVARLILYEQVAGAVWRKVAVFDKGWHYGRLAHLRTIERLVERAERV